MMLKPSDRQVQKARSVSSEHTTMEPRSLQPTLQSQQGHSMKKSLSEQKSNSEERTCKVEKIPSTIENLFSQKPPSINEKPHTRVKSSEGGVKRSGGGDRSNKQHPAQRGCSVKGSSSLSREPSVPKDQSGGSHHSNKSSPEEEGRLVRHGSHTSRRPSEWKDHPTGRSWTLKKNHPAVEGLSAESGIWADRRRSEGQEQPAGRSCPQNSHLEEEVWVFGRDKSAKRGPSAGKDHPFSRGQPLKKSRLEEDSCSAEGGNHAERRASAGEDYPTGRGQPQKKSHPAKTGHSVKRKAFAGKDPHIGRGRVPKKSQPAERHPSRSMKICPPKKHGPAENVVCAKRVRSPERVHSMERIHLAKKSCAAERQLCAEKGSMAELRCSFLKDLSRETANSFQESCTPEEGSWVHNMHSVEKGHPSMEKGFPEEKVSSGFMSKVTEPNNMPSPPENTIGSDTNQVVQVPPCNVPVTVKIKMGVELMVPYELKARLVEDWDLITKQKQLYHLPAEKSVDTILEEYVTFVKSQGLADNREYSADELIFGIRVYFNNMLATQLLYQFERPQYAQIHLAYPDIPMSQVYGAPHLLRLFMKIGTALAYSPLNRQSLLLVSNYMHGFLEYLVEHSTSLFNASNYRVASAEYCCKAL